MCLALWRNTTLSCKGKSKAATTNCWFLNRCLCTDSFKCEQICELQVGFIVRYTDLPRGRISELIEWNRARYSCLGCHSRVHSANVSSCLSLNISQRKNGTRSGQLCYLSSVRFSTADTGHIQYSQILTNNFPRLAVKFLSHIKSRAGKQQGTFMPVLR